MATQQSQLLCSCEAASSSLPDPVRSSNTVLVPEDLWKDIIFDRSGDSENPSARALHIPAESFNVCHQAEATGTCGWLELVMKRRLIHYSEKLEQNIMCFCRVLARASESHACSRLCRQFSPVYLILFFLCPKHLMTMLQTPPPEADISARWSQTACQYICCRKKGVH